MSTTNQFDDNYTNVIVSVLMKRES